MRRYSVGKLAATAAVVLAVAAARDGRANSNAAAPKPGANPAAPTAAEQASFEDVANVAVPAPKADALVAAYAADCDRSRREIDRARCRGTQDFLKARLPKKLLRAVVDSTRVVSVSAYDAGVRGLRVRLVGCLTCDEPAEGPEGGEHYATFAVPSNRAESLREGVIVGETVMSFADPAAAKQFEAEVRPHLRAEVIFRGAGTAWSHRGKKGVAFNPVAMRIFNRCTGEVVFSQPRSLGPVNVVEGLPGCEGPTARAKPSKDEASTARPKEEGVEEAPEKLGARELVEALKSTRAAVAACDAQYKTKGLVDLEFDLNGTGGSAQAVRAKGNLGGTPVAACLMQAVRDAQFPRFQQARQTFSYSVRLAGGQ